MKSERRDNNDTRPEEAARSPQMRPPEAGPTLFYTMMPLVRQHIGTVGRGEVAENIKKIQEGREHCLQLDSLHPHCAPLPPRTSFENQREPPKWPQHSIDAYLQGPVATSMRAPKTTTTIRRSLPHTL